MIRKLESKKDQDKKRKRNNFILSLVLIVVLFGSIFGTFLNLFGNNSEDSTQLSYRGIPMSQQGNLFVLALGDRAFYFTTNPNEVVSYDVNISKTIPAFVGKPFYIDSFDYGVAQELAQNFQGYPERIATACINETDCVDESAPIKTCQDNIIIVRESKENKVYEVENCIYIEGTDEDLIKMTDAFILKALGLN